MDLTSQEPTTPTIRTCTQARTHTDRLDGRGPWIHAFANLAHLFVSARASRHASLAQAMACGLGGILSTLQSFGLITACSRHNSQFYLSALSYFLHSHFGLKYF